jgi:hypothetical protein
LTTDFFLLTAQVNCRLSTVDYSQYLFQSSVACHGAIWLRAPISQFVAKWEPPVGGLSQPRRDTADPKNIRPRATEQFFDCRNIADSQRRINLFLHKKRPFSALKSGVMPKNNNNLVINPILPDPDLTLSNSRARVLEVPQTSIERREA